MKKILDWQDDDIVEIYDEAPLWSAPFGKLLLDHIPMQPNWTIVDLGCGTGFPLIELAQRFGEGSRIVGVDNWKAALSRLRKKIERLELNNVEIIEKDVSDLKLDAESIDLVCSNLGVNNFDNKPTVFQKVHKMLKPGGHFCITTNNQSTFSELFHLFEKILLNLSIDTIPLKDYKESRPITEELIKQIEHSGFRLIKRFDDSSCLRFASAEALFNHSIIRIAFLESWKKLIPSKKWEDFIDLILTNIDEVIKKKGSFKISVPIHYLEFTKS